MIYKELLSKRLRIILDDIYNGNASKFGKAIGISEGSIRGYVGDKKEIDGSVRIVTPSAEIIALIIEKVGINPEWLVTGKGSMLLSDSTDEVSEDKPFYGNKTKIIPVEEYEEMKEHRTYLMKTNMDLAATNKNLSDLLSRPGKKIDTADTA